MEDKKEVERAVVFGLGKYQKAIVSLPGGENDRPHETGIKITKDGYAIATDTKIIIKIPLNDEKADQLPAEKQEINPLSSDIWVSTKALNKAIKHLPTSKTIPIINNIYIREDKDKISLVANDLENQVEVKENKKTCQENAEKYPSTDNIFELSREVKHQATLGIPMLKKLINIIDKMTDDRVKAITFFFGEGEGAQIHFSFQVAENVRHDAIGVIMPVKVDTTPEQRIKDYKAVAGIVETKEVKDKKEEVKNNG